MDSLKELFKIGHGPSSSHTMGPQKAANEFKNYLIQTNIDVDYYDVELYGSLASTGKGHLTDKIIRYTLEPKTVNIFWKPEIVKKYHTNALKIKAIVTTADKKPNIVAEEIYYSIGGGTIVKDSEMTGKKDFKPYKRPVYPFDKMEDILSWCDENGKELWQYVEDFEESDIWDYLSGIWEVMQKSIENGLHKSGVLPGPLKLPRKAKRIYKQARMRKTRFSTNGKLYAYALAVAEENADGGVIVTAPTCGSSGIVPALLKVLEEEYSLSEDEILKALAIAGLVGNLVKENASISGAEVGCQGEVGTACAMAAAMASYILGGTNQQIEYAAEMALEHHLGMTCDPVGGYVQIPCIERNAVASVRALDSANFTLFTDGRHRVSLDQVIVTMKETGEDLKCGYKETSKAGLAKYYMNTEFEN
ncbi:L-serine ammonia-lyase [Methanococcus voltae]|uniref:L-serine dehydratase n=2 Tax=Methanococcus voltae TaxID=2188 RepID=A0A8J7RG43_METVO|nr:L-serine ammonia-lyase [Methanococcus voltae]MBP2171843.1 L-serine dehydratase [Methanococcus voltae]MBP2201202.1 L-serine dehydratase [Methanococcus voltae]MCS3921925.1 L-serine dehydratase [Methanococcus voltae PS]